MPCCRRVFNPTQPTPSNNVITELRRSKYNYEKDLAAKVKTDNKHLWGYVRSKIKTKLNHTSWSYLMVVTLMTTRRKQKYWTATLQVFL